MQSVLSWPHLTIIVAVGAVLLLVLYLRTRRSTTGAVRLKLAANPRPQSVRARGAVLRRKSPGVPAKFEGMDAAGTTFRSVSFLSSARNRKSG
jgi:hypothetical protein